MTKPPFVSYVLTLILIFSGIAPFAQQRDDVSSRAESRLRCRESITVRREAPPQEGADPLGAGPWYINADSTIWALKQKWQPGTPMKTAWIRPAGATLRVTGRRLDGDAPAMQAAIPARYSSGFQPSRLMFPTIGCWEVTATADDKTLVFVTLIS